MPSEITLHGTFLSLYGVGTHIMGEPGIGKSELALSLIHHNHQLIADDAPLFTLKGGRVLGTNPLSNQFFLSLRGIGLIDIPALFGPTSIRKEHSLDLIFKLTTAAEAQSTLNHLHGIQSKESILGCLIPTITIPIIKPRNLVIIVETLVKQFLLQDLNQDSNPITLFDAALKQKMELNPS